jgi:hypothetical protein
MKILHFLMFVGNFFGRTIYSKKLTAIFFSILFLTTAKSQVIVSEIDYDQVGQDNNEKIELFGVTGTDLTGWQLVLYNGSNTSPYNTINLTGSIPFTCTGSNGVSYGVVLISFVGSDKIQNGAPDGWALVNAGGTVVEFLSYEGIIIFASSGPAAGMTSIDIAPGLSDSNSQEGTLEKQSNNSWIFSTPGSLGICNTGLIVLPLRLTDFNVAKQNSTALFTWTSTNEINVSHFEIEHSTDGRNFTTLGTVTAIGNSSSSNYQFTDAAPIVGKNYYRLKMLDKDGSFKYTEIRVLNFENGVLYSVYPNPFGSSFTITSNSNNANYTLTDAVGKLVMTGKIISGSQNINTSSLAVGIYLIVVKEKGEIVFTQKIIKQ